LQNVRHWRHIKGDPTDGARTKIKHSKNASAGKFIPRPSGAKSTRAELIKRHETTSHGHYVIPEGRGWNLTRECHYGVDG